MQFSTKKWDTQGLAVFRSIRKAITITILLVVPAIAQAADYPKVIEHFVKQGVKVEMKFPAASGMTGWVLSSGGKFSIVYTAKDGKTMLAGELIDENGRNLTGEYSDKYLPKPDFAAAYSELEKTEYITEGAANNSKSLVYIFFDPNCPFCQLTWKALQPYEKVGLQVRWVPLGYLGPTSMPKAIAIMSAADKTAAFRANEQRVGHGKNPPAGFTAADKPEIAAMLVKNGELMQKFGMDGTPGIVWKDKSGKINIKSGMPRLAEIPAMTGLPEQKEDDPDLARFR
jgi:thiol:disulfide interchange protein DsbG